jgi:hypothetical protein
LRSGLLLGPSPEDGRDDYVSWRILQMRCDHALYPVDASTFGNAKANSSATQGSSFAGSAAGS